MPLAIIRGARPIAVVLALGTAACGGSDGGDTTAPTAVADDQGEVSRNMVLLDHVDVETLTGSALAAPSRSTSGCQTGYRRGSR